MDKGDVGGLPNKQTTTMLALAMEQQRYLLLLMPRSPASHLLIFPLSADRTPPPSPQPPLASCDKLNRTEGQMKRSCVSSRVFLPLALRGKRGAKEEKKKFQNGAYCLYFSPLMLVPSTPHPPLSQSHQQ